MEMIPDEYMAVHRHGFGKRLYEEVVEPQPWNNDKTYGPRVQGYTSWAGTWIRTGSGPVERSWVRAEPWTPDKPQATEDPERVKLLDVFDQLVYGVESPSIWEAPLLKSLIELYICRTTAAMVSVLASGPSKLTAAGQWWFGQSEGLDVVWTEKTKGWWKNVLQGEDYHPLMSQGEFELWRLIRNRLERVEVPVDELHPRGWKYQWKIEDKGED